MNGYFLKNVVKWLAYSLLTYIVLIPFEMWIKGISISLIIGFLFGMLNAIINELIEINNKIVNKNAKKKKDAI